MVNIKKNENYTIDITGMTHEGQGVGRIENFTVFTERAIVGETVEIKIIKINKSYAVGKLIKVIKPSSNRTEPFCHAFKRCGGCNLQHMSYKAQLDFKTNTVKDSLKRIGKIEDAVIHDTIGMSAESGQEGKNYRNKAQYPVGNAKDGLAVGFYAPRSHDIVDNPTCGIQNEISDRVRNIVKEFIADNGISVYDEASNRGLVRHVMTRVGFKTGEVMVVIVINGSDFPKKKAFIEALTSRINAIKSIFLNVNTQKTNVILGDENIKLYGEDTITDYIGRFRFKISPLSFFQINAVQTEVLYEKALKYADLQGSEVVFDLYCGIGTISLFLSQKAKRVYGVEVVEEAIRDAEKNAELNSVDNVEFIAGEAEKVIPELYKQGVKADVVVVDPPRKGCDEVLLDTLVKMQPERIVYVSCNPSTLARDLKYLSENGFRTVEVQPVDMFPHTTHVECVVRLDRKHS
ncbi:MAG: 23S rRNA (uracil(1939)-C(5))-methyltransferase RlmD [Clostridia bacterium]|nr:23S rRNA (uracil(1939)-C(5))-methyltransferase RlmD [Clostridia bacterium]